MSRILIACITGLAVGTTALQAQQTDDGQVKARQRISMMEGTLERAVSIGADNLLRKVRAVMPDAPMLSGMPEVRGFRLDGYGIFFDVEVPALRLPVTWPLRYMVRDNRDLEILAAELRALMTQIDARYQEQFAQVVRRLEIRAQGAVALRGPAGSVAATQVATQPTAAAVDSGLLDDPNEGYTREVRAALIDAMLENSGPLALGPEEWLTVAARDNLPRDPLVPGDTADFSTLTFRVKGSELAAFRAGRLTLDEARQRVEIREY
jgi:AcrR family transcriptional regulator